MLLSGNHYCCCCWWNHCCCCCSEHWSLIVWLWRERLACLMSLRCSNHLRNSKLHTAYGSSRRSYRVRVGKVSSAMNATASAGTIIHSSNHPGHALSTLCGRDPSNLVTCGAATTLFARIVLSNGPPKHGVPILTMVTNMKACCFAGVL